MGAEALGPPRSTVMVWLESAPARLVTTVDVVGELVSPSKTTTPAAVPATSGANTIARWPAVTRSPGLRISRALSGMLLTNVPFLLPRSCTVQSSSSGSNAKCWRERPASSGKQSSAALERPTDRRAPVSGTVFTCPSGHWTRSSRDMVRSSELAISLHYRRREERSLTPKLDQLVKIARVGSPAGAHEQAFEPRVGLVRVHGFRHRGAQLGLELGVKSSGRDVVDRKSTRLNSSHL